MTYLKKYGNYAIYTDGTVFKWFKDFDKALNYWKNDITLDPETIEEWLEEYESVKLVNLRTGEIIEKI